MNNQDNVGKNNTNEVEIKFLNLLSQKFPTVQAACTEIINLESILNLLKEPSIFLQIFMANMKPLAMFCAMHQGWCEKNRQGISVHLKR